MRRLRAGLTLSTCVLFVSSRAVDPLAGRGIGRVDDASCKSVDRPRGFSQAHEEPRGVGVRARR
jgi:hypothetical protein